MRHFYDRTRHDTARARAAVLRNAIGFLRKRSTLMLQVRRHRPPAGAGAPGVPPRPRPGR